MLIEMGPEIPVPFNRADSWYDRRLVTAEGEKILERHDTAGIEELRRSGLVWSSQQHDRIIIENPDETGLGVSRVISRHPKRLRLFILSLLWRAAATDFADFCYVRLQANDLEYLRCLVFNGEVGEASEFPIFFLSLIAPGKPHNHTPIRQRYGEGASAIELFRFYFDGLIAFVGDRMAPREFVRELRPYFVGFDKEFLIMARPFEGSRQDRDLVDMMIKAHGARG